MNRSAPRAALLAPLLLAAGCARLFPGVDVGAAPTALPPVTPAVGDAPIAPTDAAPLSTPWPEGDVARLLADPPAAGEVVELDVYTSYAPGIPGWSSEPSLGVASGNPCQDRSGAWLTDRPAPSIYSFGNLTIHGNKLPVGAAWLIAATKPTTAYPPPSQALPFHARVKGHLGDASYASCEDAAHIFVIDEVVRDYGDQPPASSVLTTLPLETSGQTWIEGPRAAADWPRYSSPKFGFTIAYPPAWQVREGPDGDLAFVVPNRPDVVVQLKARAGETSGSNVLSDPWLAITPDAVSSGISIGGDSQEDPSPGDAAGIAALSGQQFTCTGGPLACIRDIFNHEGNSYLLAIDFPTGFDVPQDELWLFTAMIDSFRVRNQPTKTPAPPETGTPAPPGQS